jgi:hypothetical protein
MGGLNTTGTTTVYLRMVNSAITITTKAGAVYVLPVPNAKITFQNATTDATASTSYNAATDTWETTIGKTTAGNTFLSAIPWTVPAGVTDLAGASFKWTGTFLDSSAAVDVSSWDGAAAVYNTTSPAYTVPSELNMILVKPTDSSSGAAPYNNTDKAGTPELFKTKVIAGALGTGGTAYIGSYTANGNPTDINVIRNLFVDDATQSWLSSSVDPLS